MKISAPVALFTFLSYFCKKNIGALASPYEGRASYDVWTMQEILLHCKLFFIEINLASRRNIVVHKDSPVKPTSRDISFF